ncbi:hypothetical protein G3I66_21975, partial [Streptomyces rubrogriseus]|nr:hypothetical protein [Streptomyces rubrogriseus]
MPTIVASAGTMARHRRSRAGGGTADTRATGEAPLELSRPSRLGRRAFSALAGTTVLGLALGGSTVLPASGAPGPAP